MTKIISGAWEKIVMVNYVVNPGLLLHLVPHGTQISLYDGQCFVTLAGFVFSDIRVLGVRVPFHRHVPEVNLRFYVEPQRKHDNEKGVVFIKELAAKPLLATMANLFYKQNYKLKHVGYTYSEERSSATIKYTWGRIRRHSVKVKLARKPAVKVKAGSEEDYIFHNFFGYATKPDKPTLQYQVSHPDWPLLPVIDTKVKVNFEKSFGKEFGFLSRQKPHSVFVTDGSPISIHLPRRLPFTPVGQAA